MISTKIAKYVYHLNNCYWAILEKNQQGAWGVDGGMEFPGVN